MNRISRRDALKLGGLGLGALAAQRFPPPGISYDDTEVVRVAGASASVYSRPDDTSAITGTWYRDQLLHTYAEVKPPASQLNAPWYRVWGGYVWGGRLQKVATHYNDPITLLPDALIPGKKGILAEVTVPFTNPWYYTQRSGWEQLDWRMYFGSVHWIDEVGTGPAQDKSTESLWYRIWDHVASFPYYVRAAHLRPIQPNEYAPISPAVPFDKKRIEVNLTLQRLTAYEYDKPVFTTLISSGVDSRQTRTHTGSFRIIEKFPSEHMGGANVYSTVDGYQLPGIPWTSYFSADGQAFHGTYWHNNFGTPMSHGCINMRSSEALWLFRWATPIHKVGSYVTDQRSGTAVEIHT